MGRGEGLSGRRFPAKYGQPGGVGQCGWGGRDVGFCSGARLCGKCYAPASAPAGKNIRRVYPPPHMTCMCPPPQYTTDVGLRGRTSGRADDNEEAIQKRFKVCILLRI